jgi:hypothetical protein
MLMQTDTAAPERLEAALSMRPSVYFSNMGLKVDGKPFNLADYPYLLEPYDLIVQPDAPQHVCIEKGAQEGWSIWAILTAIYCARFIYLSDHIIYYFPTERLVLGFSKSRFGPMLEENDALSEFVGGINSALLKSVRNINGSMTFIDFLGMQSKEALKSIPSHHNFYDESDEMADDRVARSRHRLDNSEFARTTTLSTPTLPNWGVDFQFRHTDRRYWLLRCEACNTYTCMEHEWPECLHRMADGTVIRACSKCGNALNRVNGVWVPEAPGEDVAGFRISQLNSKVDPKVILDEHETGLTTDKKPVDITEFHNQRLARGYVESDAQLSEEQVWDCCGTEPTLARHPGPCAMGVDVKMDQYHYMVGSRTGEHRFRIWKWGIAPTLDAIADIARAFCVERAVIDAMPDLNLVKMFCETFPWAWRTFLPDNFQTSPVWNMQEWVVKANRNEVMEAGFNTVVHRRLVLPRRDANTERVLVKAFTNMAKTTKQDEQTGVPKTRWVVLGAKDNDMWMAWLHFLLAAESVPIISGLGERQRLQPVREDYDPLELAERASNSGRGDYDPLGGMMF